METASFGNICKCLLFIFKFRAIARSLYGYDSNIPNEQRMSESDFRQQEAEQKALRRAVAREMLQLFPTLSDDDRVFYQQFAGIGTSDRIRSANVHSLEDYARMMFEPAHGSLTRWANSAFEGLFAAQVLQRPIIIITENPHAVGYSLIANYPNYQQNVKLNFVYLYIFI
jgi:hypothetical protein